MTVSCPAPPDASALAAEVRQLARHAHRLLNDPATDPQQLDDLSRRVARLRRQVNGRSALPVARWLDHLEQKLPARSARG
jgi:hypothetical protein